MVNYLYANSKRKEQQAAKQAKTQQQRSHEKVRKDKTWLPDAALSKYAVADNRCTETEAPFVSGEVLARPRAVLQLGAGTGDVPRAIRCLGGFGTQPQAYSERRPDGQFTGLFVGQYGVGHSLRELAARFSIPSPDVNIQGKVYTA